MSAKVALLYEHPSWFTALIGALERRSIEVIHLDATRLRFDPADSVPYDLVVNRMSPSAGTRGNEHALLSSLHYLEHLERTGVPVLNGVHAFRSELSKVAQLGTFEDLGVRYPRTRVVNHTDQLRAAATGLRFPIVVKPNIGGSGAGIVGFEDLEALTVAADGVDLGIDDTALVQERLPARGDRIVRVEVLGDRVLYAIELDLTPGSFNLCPADYCLPGTAGAGNDEGPVRAVEVPPSLAHRAVEIVAASGAEIGGVEYLVDDRDGEAYFYDVNALSNFVADAPRILGFDPHEDLADYIVARAVGQRLPVASR
jgi:glutathione synthase/RimK-type ligase-like ATP-grasp enzyme